MEIRIEVKDNRTASVGDYFKLDNDIYLLSSMGDGRVGLINVRGGSIYASPIKVKYLTHISSTELDELTNGIFITKCSVTIKP